MAALKNDPNVIDLVTAGAAKAKSAAMKDAIRELKAIVIERVADAKSTGNRDAARYLTSLGADLTNRFKAYLA